MCGVVDTWWWWVMGDGGSCHHCQCWWWLLKHGSGGCGRCLVLVVWAMLVLVAVNAHWHGGHDALCWHWPNDGLLLSLSCHTGELYC